MNEGWHYACFDIKLADYEAAICVIPHLGRNILVRRCNAVKQFVRKAFLEELGGGCLVGIGAEKVSPVELVIDGVQDQGQGQIYI